MLVIFVLHLYNSSNIIYIILQALVAVGSQQALVPKKAPTMPKPEWHPPWKLYRVSRGCLSTSKVLVIFLFLLYR